ncbi:MAG: hypothetical protein IJ161_08485 [Bacteroidales bacterium]|nr:hypothetical protein [Bacteroidales bacterium]
MKRLATIFSFALLSATACPGQTRSWEITQSGWGHIQEGISVVFSAPEVTIGEINIPRWRDTPGTVTIDFGKRVASIVINKKKVKTKEYDLMTESEPHKTRDGWTFTEYEGLDELNEGCRFWICRHESGSERILILKPYRRPHTVYGYKLSSKEQ